MLHAVATHPDLPKTRKLLIDFRLYTAIPRLDILEPMAVIARKTARRVLRGRQTAVVTLEGSQSGAAAFVLQVIAPPPNTVVGIVHSLRDAQRFLGLALFFLLACPFESAMESIDRERRARTRPDRLVIAQEQDRRHVAYVVTRDQRPRAGIAREDLLHWRAMSRRHRRDERPRAA